MLAFAGNLLASSESFRWPRGASRRLLRVAGYCGKRSRFSSPLISLYPFSSHFSLSSLLIPPLPGMEKGRRDPSHCLLDDRHLYYNQITSLPATAFNALTSLTFL